MRVLIVEDDPGTLRTWKRVLERDGFTVLPATGQPEAERLLASEAPSTLDGALVDLVLQQGNGLELLSLLRDRFPRTGIALVTGFLDADVAVAAQSRGVMVVPKPLSAPGLRRLVRLLCCTISGRLTVQAVFPKLSFREAKVVQLAMAGCDDDVIAGVLGCRPSTVDTYWRRIRKKTDLHSRFDIVRWVLGSALDRPAKGTLA